MQITAKHHNDMQLALGQVYGNGGFLEQARAAQAGGTLGDFLAKLLAQLGPIVGPILIPFLLSLLHIPPIPVV